VVASFTDATVRVWRLDRSHRGSTRSRSSTEGTSNASGTGLGAGASAGTSVGIGAGATAATAGGGGGTGTSSGADGATISIAPAAATATPSASAGASAGTAPSTAGGKSSGACVRACCWPGTGCGSHLSAPMFVCNLAVSADSMCDVLVGHTSSVTKIAISHDGEFILSASLDGTVRLWLLGQKQCAVSASTAPPARSCTHTVLWSLLLTAFSPADKQMLTRVLVVHVYAGGVRPSQVLRVGREFLSPHCVHVCHCLSGRERVRVDHGLRASLPHPAGSSWRRECTWAAPSDQVTTPPSLSPSLPPSADFSADVVSSNDLLGPLAVPRCIDAIAAPVRGTGCGNSPERIVRGDWVCRHDAADLGHEDWVRAPSFESAIAVV
jgi:hypothetical protein